VAVFGLSLAFGVIDGLLKIGVRPSMVVMSVPLRVWPRVHRVSAWAEVAAFVLAVCCSALMNFAIETVDG